MKKYIYLILLAFVPAFFCFIYASQPEAIYEKLAKEYILYADGSQEYKYSMELTLFTHTAMNRTYGESFIVYNPLYQELKIHSSYTRQKDGTIIQTPENAFVEVLPRKAANAPAYNHLLEMVVVHTGLELGATIYLEYSILSKAGYLPELDVFEELQQSSPVKEYTITLTVPENKPLHAVIHPLTESTSSITKGYRTINYILTDLPAVSQAPDVSVMNGDVPFLSVSTYPTEQDALAFLYKEFNPAKDYWQFFTFAEAVTEGKETEEEKFSTILDYVYNQLDHSPLSLQETGFRIRPLDEVTGSAYGTEAEKANMLYTLLSVLEYKPELKVAYKVVAPEGTLGLNAIREFIVSCYVGEQVYELNPVQNSLPQACFYPDLLPIRNLSLKGEKSNLTIPSTSGEAEFTITINPVNEAEVIMIASKSLLSKTYPSSEPEVKKTETIALISPAEGYAFFHLPRTPFDISKKGYASYNTIRDNILSIPYIVNEDHIYKISLSHTLQVSRQNERVELSNRVGEFLFVLEKTGSEVEIRRKLKLNTTFITPDLYKEFRGLMVAWENQNNMLLLLKTVK